MFTDTLYSQFPLKFNHSPTRKRDTKQLRVKKMSPKKQILKDKTNQWRSKNRLSTHQHTPVKNCNNITEYPAQNQDIVLTCWGEANEIIPNVYVSGKKPAQNCTYLQQLGITTILIVSAEEKPLFPNIFRYMHLPIDDCPGQTLSFEEIDMCCNFITESIRNREKILVHCTVGISRSVAIVCAFLMIHLNVSLQQSVDLIRTKRPIASPAVKFLNIIQEWYDKRMEEKQLCIKEWYDNMMSKKVLENDIQNTTFVMT